MDVFHGYVRISKVFDKIHWKSKGTEPKGTDQKGPAKRDQSKMAKTQNGPWPKGPKAQKGPWQKETKAQKGPWPNGTRTQMEPLHYCNDFGYNHCNVNFSQGILIIGMLNSRTCYTSSDLPIGLYTIQNNNLKSAAKFIYTDWPTETAQLAYLKIQVGHYLVHFWAKSEQFFGLTGVMTY